MTLIAIIQHFPGYNGSSFILKIAHFVHFQEYGSVSVSEVIQVLGCGSRVDTSAVMEMAAIDGNIPRQGTMTTSNSRVLPRLLAEPVVV